MTLQQWQESELIHRHTRSSLSLQCSQHMVFSYHTDFKVCVLGLSATYALYNTYKLTNLTLIHPFVSSEDLIVTDVPGCVCVTFRIWQRSEKHIACQCSCFLRLAPSISLLLCVTLILVVGGATPADRINCHVHPFVFITSPCPTHPIPTRSHQPAPAGKAKQN